MRPKQWEGVSEQAKDLMKMMLEPNQEERITAKDALAHPWLRVRNGVGDCSSVTNFVLVINLFSCNLHLLCKDIKLDFVMGRFS